MPLVVGIDEAGFGPTLGPLVVGASLWHIPDKKLRCDLWRELRGAVTRAGEKSSWKLAVDDSKQVYDRQRLATLERPVLAFARAAGLPCDSFVRLAGAMSALAPSRDIPWYAELDLPLPIDGAPAQFDAVAEKLARCMDAAGVRCCGLLARVVTEDHYNDRVAATRNKSAVVVEQVLSLIDACGRGAGERVVFHVDRLGGRVEYRRLLQTAFPDRAIRELEIDAQRSRYRLSNESSDWFISFEVSAEKAQLPVALASMLAKYLREVIMRNFNAFWRRWAPDVRPTAGYYNDAQRFLADIAPILGQAGVPRERFVRSR